MLNNDIEIERSKVSHLKRALDLSISFLRDQCAANVEYSLVKCPYQSYSEAEGKNACSDCWRDYIMSQTK